MLRFVNEHVKEIAVPDIRKFSNEVTQYADGINLTIGEPDFPTPDIVKQAGIESIQNDLTSYSHNAGLIELRRSVANFFEEKYSFSFCPESEIIITNGASEGIDSVLRTILSPGDEVIITAPIYSAYEPIVHLCGGKTIYLDTTSSDFVPDVAVLEEMINKKTKAVILNYPSNPTGKTLAKEIMDDIAKVIEVHNVFLISDEIYSENTFNGVHHSFGAYKSIRNKLFLLHGLSKSHSMTGWRIGYVLGEKSLIEQVLKVHLYNSICAPLPSQYAAIKALNDARDVPNEMNAQYIRRRDYLMERIERMGLDVIKPEGAFYLFPSIKSTNLTSYEYATRLFAEEHVAVVPGSGFTRFGEGFIRISYANSMDNLIEAMDRMERFINRLQQEK